ncbi:MAG: hypothetical protein D6795_09425, partial [Deltaproteobacteria bacterium]
YRFIDGIMVEGKFWQMIEEYGGQESLRAQQDALFVLSIRAYAKGQQTRAFDYFNRYLTSDTPYSLRYQIARKLLEEMNRQVRASFGSFHDRRVYDTPPIRHTPG